jgi:DNA-binding transcriptional regulator YdaS (Cro superfamily)
MALTQHNPARRRQIAEVLGIDEQYVYQISTGRKTASPALARRWNEFEPADSLRDLRPDDWQVIWPELIGQDQAQAEGQG